MWWALFSPWMAGDTFGIIVLHPLPTVVYVTPGQELRDVVQFDNGARLYLNGLPIPHDATVPLHAGDVVAVVF